jgi:hypothetical protein
MPLAFGAGLWYSVSSLSSNEQLLIQPRFFCNSSDCSNCFFAKDLLYLSQCSSFVSYVSFSGTNSTITTSYNQSIRLSSTNDICANSIPDSSPLLISKKTSVGYVAQIYDSSSKCGLASETSSILLRLPYLAVDCINGSDFNFYKLVEDRSAGLISMMVCSTLPACRLLNQTLCQTLVSLHLGTWNLRK